MTSVCMRKNPPFSTSQDEGTLRNGGGREESVWKRWGKSQRFPLLSFFPSFSGTIKKVSSHRTHLSPIHPPPTGSLHFLLLFFRRRRRRQQHDEGVRFPLMEILYCSGERERKEALSQQREGKKERGGRILLETRKERKPLRFCGASEGTLKRGTLKTNGSLLTRSPFGRRREKKNFAARLMKTPCPA